MKLAFKEYENLLSDRPEKAGEDAVGYRKATPGQPTCAGCIHYYVGVLRAVNVCEIMRPGKDNEHVRPDYCCNYQTSDGETFPLLPEAKRE